VQPLDELGVDVGGTTMPPAGWIEAFAIPVLCPGFHWSDSVYDCGVGETSLKVGFAV
jgi:hypothetical protein